MTKKKDLLFSVTKDDLEITFFRAGGKGGQKQNKTSSACRIKHKESGAIGECRNFRKQSQNKREAFLRMANSKEFQAWVRLKAAGKEKERIDIEKWVDEQMRPDKLKIEYGEDID